MTDMMAPEVPADGAREPKTIKIKLGTGPQWNAPVDLIRAMLESMSADNPAFVGRHLQAAFMGTMPKTGRPRQETAGPE